MTAIPPAGDRAMSQTDSDQTPASDGSLLPLVLTGLAATGFVLFLAVITGGWFLFVVATVAGLFLFGLCHYWLWGHALTQQLADEQLANEAAATEPDVSQTPTTPMPGHRSPPTN
jgi:hypothetical protein